MFERSKSRLLFLYSAVELNERIRLQALADWCSSGVGGLFFVAEKLGGKATTFSLFLKRAGENFISELRRKEFLT